MRNRFVYFVNHDWAQIKQICARMNIKTGVTINGESLLPDDFQDENLLRELADNNVIQIRYKDVTK